MKMRNLTLAVMGALAVTALATSSPLRAQDAPPADAPTTTVTDGQTPASLSGEFTTFAGSGANAQALVTGLRDGTEITLDETATNPDGTTTTSQTVFQPATGKLGYGNVEIALSLAEASLVQAGISDPTAEEIAAALNGGTLILADGSSVELDGVLVARADGQGWGQIAHTLGFKLGEVMRSPHAAGAADAHASVKVAKVELAARGRAEHPRAPERVVKVERPERVVRPDRPQRPERPERPERAGRPGG